MLNTRYEFFILNTLIFISGFNRQPLKYSYYKLRYNQKKEKMTENKTFAEKISQNLENAK